MDDYYDEDDPGEDKYLDKDEEEKIPLAIKKKQEVKGTGIEKSGYSYKGTRRGQ